jgi:hypothetical protein
VIYPPSRFAAEKWVMRDDDPLDAVRCRARHGEVSSAFGRIFSTNPARARGCAPEADALPETTRHISSILSQAAFGIASSILALLAAVTPARAQATPVLDQLATHNLVRDSPSSGKPGKGKPVKATCEENDPIEFSPASVTRNRKEDALMESFRNSFAMGAAIPGAELNQAERRLLFANFNTVTPENCMKWQYLCPKEGIYRFEPVDRLVDFATKNRQSVVGLQC